MTQRRFLSAIIGTVASSTLSSFAKQCAEPRITQERVLQDILHQNKDCAFGRDYGFASINSVKEWQKKMPICTYAEHKTYVELTLKGESSPQLTTQLPVLFATTSGTTGASKYIPVTPASKASKSKMMRIWLSALYRDHPDAFNGKVLTVVSPEEEESSPSGIPCGAESGHGYRAMPSSIKAHYSTPYEAFEIKDYAAKYYALLRISCGQNISMLYTVNPSTVIVLAQKIGEYTKDIIRDVREGTLSSSYDIAPEIRALIEADLRPDPQRAMELEAAAYRGDGVLLPKHVWQNLACVCCWKGGTVGMYLDKFDHYFPPGIPVRDVGYFASEVRGSVVISDDGPEGVLSIPENFFEFSEITDPDPEPEKLLLADQLEIGKQYFIYVTTKAGLYRYDMNDIIEITGSYEKTPMIRFVQKGKGMVSFTGEKLSETQVIASVDAALSEHKGNYEFITGVGEVIDGRPRYAFLVEFDQPVPKAEAKLMLEKIESKLQECNQEYTGKRKSLRIGEPVLRIIKPGEFADYRARVINKGKSDGQFKTLRLTRDTKFAGEFSVDYEIGEDVE
jgi:hypothetical protein